MESVADALVEKVNARVAKLTVGSPWDNADITPVVSESSANFIEGLVKDAQERGATLCQVRFRCTARKRSGAAAGCLFEDPLQSPVFSSVTSPWPPVTSHKSGSPVLGGYNRQGIQEGRQQREESVQEGAHAAVCPRAARP